MGSGLLKNKQGFPVPLPAGAAGRWVPLVLFGFLVMAPVSTWAAFKPESPNSCIDCHRTLDDKRLSAPVALWTDSVHAEVGNTCDGCHGGDPADPTRAAMSKQNRFHAAPSQEGIGTFCGKCHQELADNFLTSAHGLANEPTCIDCHGSHSIRRISLQIINSEACSGCHEYAPAEKLKNILLSLHLRFKDSVDQLVKIEGFPTEPARKDLNTIWKKLRQVRMISHTFDIPRIEKEAEAVDASLKRAGEEIQRLKAMGQQRARWGSMSVLMFIGLAILTYFYNRQNKDFKD